MNPSEHCSRSRFVILAAFVFLLPMFLIQSSTAQKSRVVRNTNPRRDSQIAKVVSEINPKNIERTIRKLVSLARATLFPIKTIPIVALARRAIGSILNFKKPLPSRAEE